MPTEYVTVTLTNPGEDDEVKITGKDLDDDDGNPVNEDEQQIVTILDGGDLEDDGGDPATFVFEFFGKTSDDDDEFHLDLSGFDDDFNIEVKSQDPGDCWYITGWDSYTVVGNVYTFTYTGTDGNTHTMTIDAESTNPGFGVACVVVCFVRGTRIRTPRGDVPVETLSPDDEVCCGDGVNRPVRWIGSRVVSPETLKANNSLRPVVFQRGALADGVPSRTLRLSPQHRVLLRDWRAELLFGENEVLVPAISLQNDKDIVRDHSCEEVEYFHILLDGHHTVFADGVESESLMPAEMALSALDGAARDEVFFLFPELAGNLQQFGPLCRRVLKNYETDVLRSGMP